jgi:diacylglycerol kinase (ATP)
VAAQFFSQRFDFVGGIFHRPLIYNLTSPTTPRLLFCGAARTSLGYGSGPESENTIASYRNTVLIYNPRAGKFGHDGAKLLKRAVEILTDSGHSVTVAPTTGPRTAGAIASDHISRGADLILAAGGDGTVNEVADGMVGSHVPLAVLPAGTANVLAMEMKLGGKFLSVAARLGECRPHRISVGRVTCDGGRVSRHFLLMAGAGLDAEVVYHVSAGLKSRMGKLAYWLAGWSMLGRRLPELRVNADGREYRCSFALLSKVRNYGGDFEIAREVNLFENQFEMVLFEGRSSTRYVKYFVGLALNRLHHLTGVTDCRARHITLAGPGYGRVYVQIDGELAGRLPAEVTIVPDALTLLVPPEYRPE